jgi:hypothetical protein
MRSAFTSTTTCEKVSQARNLEKQAPSLVSSLDWFSEELYVRFKVEGTFVIWNPAASIGVKLEAIQ